MCTHTYIYKLNTKLCIPGNLHIACKTQMKTSKKRLSTFWYYTSIRRKING